MGCMRYEYPTLPPVPSTRCLANFICGDRAHQTRRCAPVLDGSSGSLGPLLSVGCAASAGPNLWVSAEAPVRPGPLIPPAVPVTRPSIGSQAGPQSRRCRYHVIGKVTHIQ